MPEPSGASPRVSRGVTMRIALAPLGLQGVYAWSAPGGCRDEVAASSPAATSEEVVLEQDLGEIQVLRRQDEGGGGKPLAHGLEPTVVGREVVDATRFRQPQKDQVGVGG